MLWKKMAKNADLFIPRSEEVLIWLGLPTTEAIHSMADAVFASHIIKPMELTDGNRVVISVANLQQDNEEAFNRAMETWIGVVKTLLDKGNSVDLIAFTKDKDDKMINAIMFAAEIQGVYNLSTTEMRIDP